MMLQYAQNVGLTILYLIIVYISAYLRNYYIQNEVPDDTIVDFWKKVSTCCVIQGCLAMGMIPLIWQRYFPPIPVGVLLCIAIGVDIYLYRITAKENVRLDEEYSAQEVDADEQEERKAA
jgi:hypothetical protein